jgi:hypothetical protein
MFAIKFEGAAMIDLKGDNRGEVNPMPLSRRSFSRQHMVFRRILCGGEAHSLASPRGKVEEVSDTGCEQGVCIGAEGGNGLYPSKGNTTLCNGGFLVGKDGALLIEGFATPAGAFFQMDALRMVSQVPIRSIKRISH